MRRCGGQTAEIYGRGLYRYDTLFVGAGNKGTDVVTLGLGIPLLVISTVLYRRGLLRGGLLLLGTLAWFLYVGVSYALGSVAYNEMFLAYVALFAASLYAFVLAFASVDLEALAVRFSPQMPRRSPGIFMLVSGVVVFAIWLMAPVTSLMTGKPPDRLDTSTRRYSPLLTRWTWRSSHPPRSSRVC
jgi:hypothetical protein